jgi:hypothetical protein
VADDVSLRDVDLNYQGIAGVLQSVDIALRDLYKQAAALNASDALERLRYTKSLIADDAPWAAKALSDFRNLIRAATQDKLTPVGRMLSKYLEQDRSWQQIVQKYGDPFDYTRSAADRLASAEKIIEKTGQSSPKMNGLQMVGKGLLVLNVITSVWQIQKGIQKQGTKDAGEGIVDIGEGATNSALAIGSYIATKKGWLTTAGGWAGLGASILAAASVSLAAEEARRSFRGEKTMIVEASDFYTDLYRRGGKERGFSGRAKQVGAAVGGFFAWPLAWLQTAGEMK